MKFRAATHEEITRRDERVAAAMRDPYVLGLRARERRLSFCWRRRLFGPRKDMEKANRHFWCMMAVSEEIRLCRELVTPNPLLEMMARARIQSP